MNPVILYLIAMMRELDMDIMRVRVYASDLVKVLCTLRFEPVDWTDTDTYSDIAISTTKEGYLRAYHRTHGEYMHLYRLSADEVLRFTSRLLHLVESGVLKLKE